MSLLEVKNVSKSFGGVKANVDISVSVEQGSIVGLIGPNGSARQRYLIQSLGLIQLIKGLSFLIILRFQKCLSLQ